MSEQFTSSPSPVVVQGQKVRDFPVLAPEAARGRVLRVTVVGEEVLHRPGTDVPAQMLGGAELSQLVDDMFRTMYAAEGVGLAGNQVGVDLRLFVFDCPVDEGVRLVGLVFNPVLAESDLVTTVEVGGVGCV